MDYMSAATSTGSTGQSTVLACTPASSRLAREFVASAIQGSSDGALDVVVTELVTNAVLHGRSRATLHVVEEDSEVLVEVGDDGTGRPELRSGPTTDTHGRGLAIVDHFADDWGVIDDVDGPGKTVWARVRLRTR